MKVAKKWPRGSAFLRRCPLCSKTIGQGYVGLVETDVARNRMTCVHDGDPAASDGANGHLIVFDGSNWSAA